MHSSWYSRRHIEALGNETSSGAVAGARGAIRRAPVGNVHAGRGLRILIKLESIRRIPHVAWGIELRDRQANVKTDKKPVGFTSSG